MAYETILTDDREGIRVVTLNRPDRLNAWTWQMAAELDAAFRAANADEDVDAIVLTGAGRGFCAGADVEAVFKAQADGEDVAGASRPGNWVDLVRESKPVVAAINGPAIGLGLTQVLPADYLVAADTAKLSLRFVKMGIVPELASSTFVTMRVGFGIASELMLTGRTLSGSEALEIGLVDRVVPVDRVVDEACAVARTMGENPRSALRQIKQLLTLNPHETDLHVVMKREGEALAACYASQEHKEAIAAFMQKREPDFRAARARSSRS
jgi:2-(1,2-epoxy-1,2-dihydrophenyl)acetyl-CoA isomerase